MEGRGSAAGAPTAFLARGFLLVCVAWVAHRFHDAKRGRGRVRMLVYGSWCLAIGWLPLVCVPVCGARVTILMVVLMSVYT